jgi:1-acyl-sn-glycerol-3-phosphate acyltransferase
MPQAGEVPAISAMTLRFFRGVVRRYFRRHFRAVQAQHADRLRGHRGPLIVYGNHSSWWDPMLIVLLGEQLLPGRRHYAPIDARALEQYPILRKLGIFPVEMASPRGAIQFLRTAEAILKDDGVLWLTPQGRFADPREFPLAFRPGLGTLALHLPEVPLLPLAVEYTFWDERLPETLLHFGEPIQANPDGTTASATREAEDALAKAMYALQTAAMARNPALFETLFSGARGTGGMYAVIRRLAALFRGRRVRLDHTLRDES